MESELKKCGKCKGNMLLKFFSKNTKTDIYFKTCDKCQERNKQYRNRYQCIHNKAKSICRECGGSEICVHNKRKNICKKCGGDSICIHNKEKLQCKECSCPIKITIKQWIHHSKQSDKKKNRFDIVNFIDKDFCKLLIEEYPKCYYTDCQIELQYDKII